MQAKGRRHPRDRPPGRSHRHRGSEESGRGQPGRRLRRSMRKRLLASVLLVLAACGRTDADTANDGYCREKDRMLATQDRAASRWSRRRHRDRRGTGEDPSGDRRRAVGLLGGEEGMAHHDDYGLVAFVARTRGKPAGHHRALGRRERRVGCQHCDDRVTPVCLDLPSASTKPQGWLSPPRGALRRGWRPRVS